MEFPAAVEAVSAYAGGFVMVFGPWVVGYIGGLILRVFRNVS